MTRITTNKIYAPMNKAADIEFNICIDYDEIETIKRLKLPENITLLPIRTQAERCEIYVNGNWTSVDFYPKNLIGFVSLKTKPNPNLEASIKFLQGYGSDMDIELYSLRDTTDLLSWVIKKISFVHTTTSVRNVRLMRELAQLRVLHDDIQGAFSALEKYADANFSLYRKQILLIEPVVHTIELDKNRPNATQLVPTHSTGLSDIGIHIKKIDERADGILSISLLMLESNERVGHWNIPVASLPEDWIQLALPKCLGTDEQSLLIDIHWSGNAKLSLSLGVSHPDPKWCVNYQNNPQNRTLALKAWRSLPHTNPTQAASVLQLENHNTQRWLVSEDNLKTVQSASHSPECVQYIDAIRGILVHPIDATPTLACLKLAAPKTAQHIFADIYNASSAAGPVEFALAILSPDRKSSTTPIKFEPSYISEWISLSGGSHSEIHLYLPAPLEIASDIYLATRIKPGASNANCNAQFIKIRATV